VGRLFWKFFALVWLAQLAFIVTSGALFWLTNHRRDFVHADIASGPVAAMQVRSAADVLRYAGVPGFRDWSEQSRIPTVLAVDASGIDLLGRPVSIGVLTAARALQSAGPDVPEIGTVSIADGRRYILFAVDSDAPLPRAGPPPSRSPNYWPRNLPPPAPIFATLAGSLLTALLLARYVAKPIRILRGAFDAASAGHLDSHISLRFGKRTDEFADLGRGFDRMTDRLRASLEGQRRLLHDVSHELRSPLARMQIAVGLMRGEPNQCKEWVQRIEDDIGRIDNLVSELLTLSRLEAGELGNDQEDVDMHDIVRDIVRDAQLEAQARGLAILWHDGGSAVLQGTPNLLYRAIENIVRNAIKHTRSYGTIRIETDLSPDQYLYRLRVLDQGPGVAPTELAKLFTPFFRGTAARGEGYGLGLSIARRCVEAHGGSIHAENRQGGGLVVQIEVPCRRGQPGESSSGC
jgi:two-component system OmpR family sensor kinase